MLFIPLWSLDIEYVHQIIPLYLINKYQDINWKLALKNYIKSRFQKKKCSAMRILDNKSSIKNKFKHFNKYCNFENIWKTFWPYKVTTYFLVFMFFILMGTFYNSKRKKKEHYIKTTEMVLLENNKKRRCKIVFSDMNTKDVEEWPWKCCDQELGWNAKHQLRIGFVFPMALEGETLDLVNERS